MEILECVEAHYELLTIERNGGVDPFVKAWDLNVDATVAVSKMRALFRGFRISYHRTISLEIIQWSDSSIAFGVTDLAVADVGD